jgi:hypothetical protein
MSVQLAALASARWLTRRPLLTEAVAVTGAAVALACALTWPLVLNLNDHIFGLGGDSTGTIAGLRLMADDVGYHLLGTTEITVAGAPFGWEQGNGVNVQSAFAFFPAYLITELSNAVVAYNFVVLSGLVLSGLAMYLLVRRLGTARLVAAWAGLVFVIFPWHLEKAQGHASFVHLEGFPLLLLAAVAWHVRPNLARALFVAGASLLLWTTSGYLGIIGGVALGVLLPISFLAHRKRFGTVRAFRWLVLAGGATILVAGFVYAIGSLGSISGGIWTPRDVGELRAYGARLWEYVVPSYRNPAFGDEVGPWLHQRLHGSNFSETSLYVGWVTLALAAGWTAWWLLRARRLSAERAFVSLALPLVALAGLLFSLPSPVVDGGPPAPSRAIWEAAPQFRVTSRFAVLVMTALVPLAALALDALAQRVARVHPRPPAKSLAFAGVCLIAGALSFTELTIVPPTTHTDLGTPPPEYEKLRSVPRGIVAEYPLAPAEGALTSDYLFWQGTHGHKLVNGAPAGTFADGVRQTLVDPMAPGTSNALAALGVFTLVVHPPLYAAIGQASPPADLGSGYRVLGRFPGGASLWRVTARQAPALAVFTEGFGPAEPQAGQPPARWLESARGTVELIGVRPGRYVARFFVGSYARPRQVRISGRNGERSFSIPPEGVTLRIPVVIPKGRSLLTVRTSPGPEPIPDGRQVTVYVRNWQFDPISAGRGNHLEPVARGKS